SVGAMTSQVTAHRGDPTNENGGKFDGSGKGGTIGQNDIGTQHIGAEPLGPAGGSRRRGERIDGRGCRQATRALRHRHPRSSRSTVRLSATVHGRGGRVPRAHGGRGSRQAHSARQRPVLHYRPRV